MEVTVMSIETEITGQVTIYEYIDCLRLARLHAFYAYYPGALEKTFVEFYDKEVLINVN